MIAREEYAVKVATSEPLLEIETGEIVDLQNSGLVQTLYVPTVPVFESLAYRAVKRIADVAIASVALVILFPALALVSLLIFVHDRGPIFYKQSRVGRYGVVFPFYKFRSMRVDADKIREQLLASSDAEGAAFKMKNDPRVTKIGRFIRKTSLDETPQLLSVLAGHMSIVGPRPHLAEEVSVYEPHQRVRLLVKPGLLCLREIKGRSNISFEEWLRLDLEYVEKRNLLLDLQIFVLAIPAVLKAEGAY